MATFAAGELALPIRRILWAPSNAAHYNHLHVEGPHVSGTLANCTSKWTEAITTIRGALDGQFGEGDHYQTWDDSLGWTHMGVYNCRNIAGTNTPSQHAFSNAIDIGPYYGVEEQKKFYDFLTMKKEDDMQFIIDTLRTQNMAFYRSLQAKTGTPAGNADYWGSDYTGSKPSQAEWEAQAMKLFAAALQTGVFSSGSGTVDAYTKAQSDARYAAKAHTHTAKTTIS